MKSLRSLSGIMEKTKKTLQSMNILTRKLALSAALSLAYINFLGRSKLTMWFRPDIIERIQQSQASKADTEEAKARREAEKKIEESGRAICMFCEDEIWKNETVPGGGWVWESEALVGYCEKGGSPHKHKPLVKYSLEEGVVIVHDK